MNRATHSAECLHGQHAGCTYEACICECHDEELFEDRVPIYDDQPEGVCE